MQDIPDAVAIDGKVGRADLKAIGEGENAVRVMTELSRKEPDSLEYKRNIAAYESEMARAHIATGQFDRALAILQNVITVTSSIAAADPGTTTTQYDIAVAHRLAAQAHKQKGDGPKATAEIQKAIDIFRKLKEMNSLSRYDQNLPTELEAELAEYKISHR